MSQPDSERLSLLLFEALELPAAARARFVAEHCGGDAELERRLKALLAEAGDEQFDSPPTLSSDARASDELVAALRASAAEAPLHEGVGTRLGPYELLRVIGEGGFGVVFEAEQVQPIARRVALKIVKLGMDTRQVVARFEQERQALALMDHPHIARVLDAGSTETGRPYFVMDLVQGKPISEFCDEQRLSVAQRLTLFSQVCEAVQHAHGKGIIHRDLKPSNVLVGLQDGQPVAKVIDFGVAKATSRSLAEKMVFTEQDQILGTLRYMSPEQAEGSLDIDTRSDVYSLGVLLYELLTGSTPFEGRRFRDAMLRELQRMIREVDPPKPSTRLHDSGAALAQVAQRRRTEPSRLESQLRGDLDWIVMKALEKDRTRRYATAHELELDIRRHLSGAPVTAAPPSASYLLRKFVRRHRGLVLASTALLLALTIGIIAFAWQSRVAAHERDEAVLARGAATTAREKADAINLFLLDMLGSADVRKLGRDVTVARALDRAAESVGAAFASRPEVEAAIRSILGQTYLSLGELEKAGAQLHKAIELERSLHGDQTIEQAKNLRALAAWHRLRAELELAAVTGLRAVEISAAVAGPDADDTTLCRVEYANTLELLERTAEAEAILRDCLATSTRLHGRESRAALVQINSLAVLLQGRKRYDEAEPLYREAAETGERVLGPEHVDTLTARMNLAALLGIRGDHANAEPLLVQTYADLKRVHGPEHPITADAAELLGKHWARRARPREALPLLEEVLAIRRATEGDRSEQAVDSMFALAQVLGELSQHERAIALYREAIDVRTELSGPEHEGTLGLRTRLADALVRANQKPEAEQILRAAIEAAERALGSEHPVAFYAINSYAVLLMNLERFAEAAPGLRRAMELGRKVDGPDHKNTLASQMNLVIALLKIESYAEAEAFASDAVERCLRSLGPSHTHTAHARSCWALTLHELGRAEEARREISLSIAGWTAALGEKAPSVARHRAILGGWMAAAGEAEEALPLLEGALEILTPTLNAADPRLAHARLELGHALAVLGRHAEAEPLLLESHERLAAVRPAGHKELRTAARYLAECYAAWNTAEPDEARAANAAAWKARAEAGR
ncbi:MAG: serine/threonine protein kinase [Planctomycetes bacterium]|nr:serine/threonine protein kinase [Planctomycetota bacterium]